MSTAGLAKVNEDYAIVAIESARMESPKENTKSSPIYSDLFANVVLLWVHVASPTHHFIVPDCPTTETQCNATHC